jgi:choline dehydrogenase-like flavoprotein
MQEQFYSNRLTLKPNTHVRRLVHESGKVSHAVCHDLLTGEDYIVKAKAFIIGCGATLTPQLMFASGIGNDNVGRYATLSFQRWILAPEPIIAEREFERVH